MGRPAAELKLAAHERETLKSWTRRPKSAQAVALRARMILRCAAGQTNTEVAAALRITKQTVGKWRRRFLNKRLTVCSTNLALARRAS